MAAQKGYTDLSKALIEKGALVNARSSFLSQPLSSAAYGGHADTCSALIEKNADVNAQNDFRSTALHSAAHGDDTCTDKECANTCAVLIKHGAKVNVQEENLRTPLHEAAMNGRLGAALVLMKNGALLRVRNDGGRTPLMLAGLNNHKEIVKALLRFELLLHVLGKGESVEIRRKRLTAAYLTLQSLGIPGNVILMILRSTPLANDRLCVLDARCCALINVNNVLDKEMLRQKLPVLLFEDMSFLKALTDSMRSARAQCRNDDLKKLLDPEALKTNFEELFLAAEKQ